MLIQVNIHLQYELSFAVDYKWSNSGICVNVKTGNIIKPVMKNRCEGYYIKSKFYSKTYLRKHLVKIKEDDKTPFD